MLVYVLHSPFTGTAYARHTLSSSRIPSTPKSLSAYKLTYMEKVLERKSKFVLKHKKSRTKQTHEDHQIVVNVVLEFRI